MSDNYFLQKYGVSDEGPEQAPVAETAPDKSASSGNYFLDKYGVYEEPKSEPVQKESAWNVTKRIGGEVVSGASEEAAKFNTMLALAASTPAMAYGKLQELFGDPKYAHLGDTAFRTFVDPAVRTQTENALKPDASTAEKLAHGIGATATMIGEVVASGGGGAAPELALQRTASETVAQTAGRAVGENVVHGTKAMQTPAISSAIDTGRRILDETGDAEAASKAAQAAYLQTVIAGIVPMSKAGNLATRVGSGAASGMTVSEAGREVQNTIVPDAQKTPFSLEDTAIAGVQGALMGGALGPRKAVSSFGTENVKSNPIDAIETAHENAVAKTAAEGGDKLDQVLAGAKAATEHAAIHDEAFADEVTRQNAEQEVLAKMQERIGALAEATSPMEVKIPESAEMPATADEAFNLREAQENAQKDSDFVNAKLQQEEQKGIETEFAKPEEPLATLGDVMPKTLKERRAQVAVQKEAAFKENEQPSKMNVEEKVKEIDAAAHEAASSPKNELPEPTEAQIDAGNYKKGHLNFQGMEVSIENPKESIRSGKTPEGQTWSQKMQDHYGYIRKTEGADGDHVDVFVGERPDSDKVYVVDQINQKTGAFDEHKAMVGYPSQLAAVRAYKRNFSKDWKVGPVKEMTVSDFKEWSQNGDTKNALQPDKIVEHRPATDADISQLAGTESKRGEQKIRYKIEDEPRVGTSLGIRSRARRIALKEQAPEKGLGIVKTGNSEWTVFEDRKPIQSYTDEATAHEDMAALQPDTVRENNASGESAASVEAINRVAEEKESGRQRFLIDHDDTVMPLHGVDSVDAAAREGQMIVQRGIGNKEWTILDRGGHSPVLANGKLNRVRSQLDEQGATRKNSEQEIHVSKQEVQAHLEEHGLNRHVQVYDTRAELPEKYHEVDNKAKGFYDPETNTAHVIADQHSDVNAVVKTVMHETVGHKGIHAILKERTSRVMQDIHDNATASEKKGLEQIAAKYGLDLSKSEDQRIAAEERVAELAEEGIDSPMLQRAITAVRAGLRRMGLVKGWSNEDIKGLLRASRKNLDAKAQEVDHADRRIRYALGDPDPIVREQPKSPLSQLAKFGATMESQAKYTPELLQRVRDNLSNFGESKGRSLIQGFLATIPRNKLPDFVGKNSYGESKIPAAQKYVDTAHTMDGYRNKHLMEDEKIAKKWNKMQKRNPKDTALMGEVMHASTLAGVDPSKEFEYSHPGVPQTKEMRVLDSVRREQYDALKPFWNRLTPEAKSMYEEVRNKYTEKRRLTQKLLTDRINDSDASPESKRVLLDTLRQQFESGKTSGPYFPLTRFGQYWAAAKTGSGEVVAASRFETPQEQKAWREQFSKRGYTTDGGRNLDQKSTVGSINPEFVAKVTDLVGGKSDLADSIWQLYMHSLPEMSMRKAYIHRLGRLGFSQNALRAYGTNMFHMSHQLARLKYMHRMDGYLQQMEKQTRALETAQDSEATWARPLMAEMNERHRWAMNPTSNPIVSALTTLGFSWHLLASPAAGVVNLTQTPIVAMPILAGEFGFARTNRALLKASMEVAGAKISSLGKETVVDRLSGEERQAMLDAEEAGSFGRTQAHMLAGATNEEGFDLTSKRRQAMEVASWIFHKSEEYNRKVTFLAAFRLAKQKGASYEDAYYKADKMTMDAHFDVSNANRARIMQSGPMKVLTLFKNYSLNMTYRLARDFREAVRLQTSDPEARTAAQKRFAGMLGMTALMAGTSGLPLSWLVHGVVNTVFGDPDSEFDSESAFRSYLTEAMGSKAATAVTRGPFEAATGVSISDRVGLNNLWSQAPPENAEGRQLNQFYMEQAAGPAISPFLSIAPAAQSANDGYYGRALERIMPKVGADLVKAFRYMREGATDTHGNTVMSKDEFSAKQLFFQSIGFVPEELSTRNAENRAVKGAEQKLQNRKELLMDKYFLAARNDDNDASAEAMRDILAFDKQNPTIAIGGQNIVASAKSRARFNALSVNGSTVNPKLGYLHNRYRFTPKKEKDSDSTD